MKKKTFLVVCLIVFFNLPTFCFAGSSREEFLKKISSPSESVGKKLYTAYNLFTDGVKVRAINFRVGYIIPVGTPVEVELYEESQDMNGPGSDDSKEGVRFKTLNDNHTYVVEFTQKYHPGKNIYEYASNMFTDRSFDQMVEGKSREVIDAIRRSAVVPGMSKEEVIMSYGYPAEHRTPSLQGNVWIYWKNRRRAKKICFDLEEKAISCKKQKRNDL